MRTTTPAGHHYANRMPTATCEISIGYDRMPGPKLRRCNKRIHDRPQDNPRGPFRTQRHPPPARSPPATIRQPQKTSEQPTAPRLPPNNPHRRNPVPDPEGRAMVPTPNEQLSAFRHENRNRNHTALPSMRPPRPAHRCPAHRHPATCWQRMHLPRVLVLQKGHPRVRWRRWLPDAYLPPRHQRD